MATLVSVSSAPRKWLHAIRGAIILAKLSCIPVRRGYWGSILGEPHTVPAKVTGKCGSVTLRLVPAPRGTAKLLRQTPDTIAPSSSSSSSLSSLSNGHDRDNGAQDAQLPIETMSDYSMVKAVHIPGNLRKATTAVPRRASLLKTIEPPKVRALDAEPTLLTQAQLRLEGKKLNRVMTYLVEIKESPQFSSHLKSLWWDISRTTLSFNHRICYIWWNLSEEGKSRNTDTDTLSAILEENTPLVQKTIGRMAMGWHGSKMPSTKHIPPIAFRLDKEAITASFLDNALSKIEMELSEKADRHQ
ncbi:40S ribosomal protein [Batrachochytrium salamandrivorans]|nr:40S ribosomal protein [Batrachochytrium salamandrivorans]